MQDINQLPTEEFVIILLLSQSHENIQSVLGHFTPQQAARVSQLVSDSEFPTPLGELVLCEFLGVDSSKFEDEELLGHLVAALQGLIQSNPFRAARSMEAYLADWRPSYMVEPRPGAFNYESLSEAEKLVALNRSLGTDGTLLQQFSRDINEIFVYTSNHLPRVEAGAIDKIWDELQSHLPQGQSVRDLDSSALAALCLKAWNSLTSPEEAAKARELTAKERGVMKVNPLIRRMFQKK